MSNTLIQNITIDKFKNVGLLSELTTDIINSVNLFTNKLNNKLIHIEYEYKCKCDELNHINEEYNKKNNELLIITQKINTQDIELTNANASLTNELKNKKFEEKNYNDVSIIKNLSKQIVEKDIKIKELESRIKYNETHGKTNNIVISPLITTPPEHNILTTLNVVNIQSNIPIDIKNINAESTVSTASNVSTITNVTKKAPVKKKLISNKLNTIPTLIDLINVIDNNTAVVVDTVVDTVVAYTVSVVDTVVDVVHESVADTVADTVVDSLLKNKIIKKTQNKKKKKVENILPDDKTNNLENVINIENILQDNTKMVPIVENNNDNNNIALENTLLINNNAIPVIPVIPVIPDIPVINNTNILFPLTQPCLDDVEMIEINYIDYYKDKLNNVYQIINDGDIGVFLGVYDSKKNVINAMR